jgi:pyruvate-formate lyase-activating enzyme
MTNLAHWRKRETGLDCLTGLDWRFKRQRGNYRMTFASRGCPVGCYFCIVPRIEGTKFTLDYDFVPAPILCDNNLSALPAEFQDHIINRYMKTNTALLDANSGFEPAAFDEDTYARWKPILRGPWHFAFDEWGERDQVEQMMKVLKAESSRRKQVYVLVGNEPVESCYERALRVIEWGGEPFCQFLKLLNWLGDMRDLKPRFDWTIRLGIDFCRYFNCHLWRSIPLAEYKPRQNEAAPFNSMFKVYSIAA